MQTQTTVESNGVEVNAVKPSSQKVEKYERSCWIDTAKAFGIFLVFLGHTLYLTDLYLVNKIIYSFHVIAFFILSGYVIRKRKISRGVKPFVAKKFKRLLLPSLIGILIMLPFYFYSLNGSESVLTIIKRITFYDGFVAYNLPVWFLIILFYCVVLEFILKIKEKSILIKLIYFFSSLIIGFLVYNFNIFIPFGIDKLFVCFAFLIFGILLRELVDKLKKNQKTMHIFLIITFVISFVLWWFLGIELNPKVSVYFLEYGNYWHFCLASLFGSSCFFIICFYIAKLTKFFEAVGKETIWILCTHYIFVRLLKYIGREYNITFTWQYSLLVIISTIVLTIIYVLVLFYIKKLIQKHKNKKKLKAV